jgi:hypothetical protein
VITVTRNKFSKDGIFGEMTDKNGHLCVTLEHAYQDAKGNWVPKIPQGTFTCVNGPHTLHSHPQEFWTYEIAGVAGHSNLLFHWGNFNKDSEGCVLLGQKIVEHPTEGPMITNSRETFAMFIQLMAGLKTFEATFVNS